METAEQLRVDGNFSDAGIAFTQLFNSVRANNGLFHEQQFVVLDRLIEINLATADWQNLKQHLDYYDWLLNRLFTNVPLSLAKYLQNSAGHHELAAQQTSGPARNWHLVQARLQLWRAVSALERLPEEQDQLPPLLHKIALHHYALSRQSDLRWLTSFETRSNEPAMISGWAMQGSDVSKRSYDIGAELMSRIMEHYEHNADSDPGTQAGTMAQLFAYRGDWDLLFGRDQSAFNFYQQSLLLAETSSCETLILHKLFQTPVALPVMTFDLSTDVCNDDHDGSPGTPGTPVQSDIYRPMWQQNEWVGITPDAALNALNTGDFDEEL